MRRKYTQDFIACTQLTARRSWPLRGKPHSHITCRCDTLQTERCFWKRQSFGLCFDVQGQQSRVERDTVQKGLTTHINDLNSKIKWTQWHWTQFNIWNLSCANLKNLSHKNHSSECAGKPEWGDMLSHWAVCDLTVIQRALKQPVCVREVERVCFMNNPEKLLNIYSLSDVPQCHSLIEQRERDRYSLISPPRRSVCLFVCVRV